jgi:energy-coupling factor transport system substrate-specific component
MNQDKLKAKDLITIAIFTVVFVIITFACVMTLGMTGIGYVFLASGSGLLCGVGWLYMRLKVPKRFTVLLQSTVCALLFFCIGAGWYIASGILIGGILAEIITSAGKYKSFKLTATGYAVYGFCFHWGIFLLALVARDYYVEYALANGTSQQSMDVLMPLLSWPVVLIGAVAAAAFSVVGILIGKALLKKHFEKAGIL